MTAIERTHLTEGTVAIAAAGTKSTSINCEGYAFGAIYTDAAIIGTALTFEVSKDGTTFVAAHDDAGTAITIGTVTTSKRYRLPDKLFPCKALKIVSGSTETNGTTFTVELEG